MSRSLPNSQKKRSKFLSVVLRLANSLLFSLLYLYAENFVASVVVLSAFLKCFSSKQIKLSSPVKLKLSNRRICLLDVSVKYSCKMLRQCVPYLPDLIVFTIKQEYLPFFILSNCENL